MEAPLRIALAQTNPVTGDLDGNAARILELCSEAARSGAELVIFPELALTGFGADDLFTRLDFLEAGERTMTELAGRIEGVTALIGYAEPLERSSGDAGPLASAASSIALIADGSNRGNYRKRLLDRRGGVDQPARFRPGDVARTFEIGTASVGVLSGSEFEVSALLPSTDLIAIGTAAPYVRGGGRQRETLLSEIARRQRAWVALADFAGGQDELVFEGASCLISPDGEVVARAGQFSEQLLICPGGGEPASPAGETAELYGALVAGLRDYVEKNGFERVAVGLSGGLDSALVAALAADALGPGRLTAVVMPSRYSSAETQGDARRMAIGLGCELIELPVEGPLDAFRELLGDDATGVADENLQARVRSNLLMTLSNSRGHLVLSTGNKSEAAVGYATLYGDMAGGLDPIQDVLKTDAFELCRYRNSLDPVIPESIIERPPSAELRPGQKDSDSLPGYDVLDRILRLYIEQGRSAREMIRLGEDPATVAEVVSLVDRSEFKRRQASPGLRVSGSSFTRDRHMPLTNRFPAGSDRP